MVSITFLSKPFQVHRVLGFPGTFITLFVLFIFFNFISLAVDVLMFRLCFPILLSFISPVVHVSLFRPWCVLNNTILRSQKLFPTSVRLFDWFVNFCVCLSYKCSFLLTSVHLSYKCPCFPQCFYGCSSFAWFVELCVPFPTSVSLLFLCLYVVCLFLTIVWLILQRLHPHADDRGSADSAHMYIYIYIYIWIYIDK